MRRALEWAPGERGDTQMRGEGESSKWTKRQAVCHHWSVLRAALARLSRKLGHVTFVAPNQNRGVGHGPSCTCSLRWEGKVWGQWQIVGWGEGGVRIRVWFAWRWPLQCPHKETLSCLYQETKFNPPHWASLEPRSWENVRLSALGRTFFRILTMSTF